MVYTVSNKTINNWIVYGQHYHLDLVTDKNISVQNTLGDYYEQQILNSVPVVIAVFPTQKEIRIYSHHLNCELFLIQNELTSKQLELHVSRILSINKNKMATEIQKCRKYDFPDFFGDVYWIHASDDTYYLIDKFIKKLNRYIPSLFEIITNWKLSLVANYDSIRIHLLKFLSLLPSLDYDKTGSEVIKNLNESLNICISDTTLPHWLIFLLKASKRFVNLFPQKLSANLIRWSVRKLATRFVVDEKNSEKTLSKIFESGRSVTLDRLGELVLSEKEADSYRDEVINVIRNLSSKIELGQKNGSGILNSHVSIKVSALCSQFKSEAYEHTFNRVAPRLRKIFDTAIEYQTFINVDAEHYEYRDCVFKIFKDVLSEYESWNDVGIVVQCYLRDSFTHLTEIKEFAESRGIVMPIRLVKGAYWDAETIEAEATGHTAYQFLNKEETDICFRSCIGYCFDNYRFLQICVGSHNFIDHLFVEHMWSVSRSHAPRPEHQCLHKTHEALSMTMTNSGWIVREYLPVGDLLDGMAYLVRRIMENASQKGVLNMMRVHKTADIRIPPVHRHLEKIEDEKIIRDDTLELKYEFVNTPPVRLYNETERIHLDESIDKYDISQIPQMSESDLNQHLSDIQSNQETWSSETKEQRASMLVQAADKLLVRRNEFAVYITKETNKTLSESLADVDEAIDFLNYYARSEMELGNLKARGAFAIVAPWNFPLAIPCGMSVASLVAGNVTFLKSSNKAHFIAHKFVELMHECGVPKSALIHVHGDRHIGNILLSNEHIAGCVFTGSKKVGSDIIDKLSTRIITNNQCTYQTKIIAETGGKNTIIVTQTADMDEAISGVLYSAFAHAGQKCSACSRVVVHKSIKKLFVERLINAIESIIVAEATNYATFVNPIVDEKETNRLLEIQKEINEEITRRRIGKIHFYVPNENVVHPMLIELDEKNALNGDVYFNEELFGPILHITEFEDIREVHELTNNTGYALTGGIFSQSADEISSLDWYFDYGNVYINRNITGARVGIEPFGGYKASGTGPKAGGETYLDSFHINEDVNQVWYRHSDKVIEKPGQTGYIQRMFSKNICFVLNKKMSEFTKSCIQELLFRGQNFDVFCCDEHSKKDIVNVIEEMDTGGRYEFVDEIDPTKNYEIFVIGNEVHSKILNKIKNGMSFNDVLPIVLSKYDHITSKTFSDLLFNTRTYAINTMKHGAELS
jgi:RHH-type proline utilization regulon transcriptional repressor/proline dehydrogenase/delta 1-pyrroline-5-carboxylate dehydrogenase